MKAFVGFAGFGGVDIALRDFGFEVVGVEIDDAIAEVNRLNGGTALPPVWYGAVLGVLGFGQGVKC